MKNLKIEHGLALGIVLAILGWLIAGVLGALIGFVLGAGIVTIAIRKKKIEIKGRR
ncbi:MAG TPA: hypothetical protein VGQ00_04540 [Candidatus Norongarragalinales archaeon]|nr:hypothetical protein [Candidatus Norongarragalinales archaeon]